MPFSRPSRSRFAGDRSHAFVRTALAGVAAAMLLAAAPAGAQEERFDIRRFTVKGNSLLPDGEVDQLLAPLAGPGRVYGDIQRALERLESAYRRAGYSTVQVYVPEQELTGGEVLIQVTENVIGQVVVSGNAHFGNENILASLPLLRQGRAPNLDRLSEAIQLANDNPAKQVDVTLGTGAAEGSVDAKVVVSDHNPQRLFFTLDNTGSAATGRYRIGASYQHANLFGRDHVATLSYATSPDSPSNVNVALYSLGYRIPLYALGDSVDVVYGRSSVNTPGVAPTLTGLLGIVGKGEVFGLRYNHYFPRRGQYTDRLVAAFDYKYTDARCDTGGVPVSIAPPTPPIASCVPYTTQPLSLTYSGQRQQPGEIWDYSLGLAYNLATGTRYTNLDGTVDRYSYLTPGNRSTRDNFTVLRGGGALQKGFKNDWQVRVAATVQISPDPLVAGEQIGLAGSGAVRGFNERAVASDSGVVLNAELYGPELAKRLAIGGNLRALAFADYGYGRNQRAAGTAVFSSGSVSSMGAGLRYSFSRDASARFDLARVVNAGPALSERSGDWRAHMSVMFGF
ncbi:Hemolysin activation/secretion protein [Noviherbaspirillum humi]|uniref:Hemolysin activation/secretion protein n=1 Tax=Noviherbaspirillum humi TaxID=1688639 RepID=A0A239J1H6_9BURK|nr:ShlB/FhaC/HecB family hemolysin secretion/activation protein [Noviherbaspirillum humi]SNS99659.1 Hemolysin activation/secretion protein [Noviherbaspirillum humi]